MTGEISTTDLKLLKRRSNIINNTIKNAVKYLNILEKINDKDKSTSEN